MEKLPPRERGARVIQVIETTVCEGEGVKGDPCRLVRYYYSLDGKLLATEDNVKQVKND